MPEEIRNRLAEVFLAHAGPARPARIGEATRLGRRGMK